MKVVGLITEYNPFHLGHKYHLERAKSIANANYTLAIMSGSFVQRGEPSFVDKWTKTKMAIDNGVDLVIELPTIFSIQSAELFAYGSIALLHQLNIVDYVAFGSELGNIDPLKEIAKVLAEEPPYFRENLRNNLNRGYSFALARNNALKDYFCKYKIDSKYPIDIEEILKMPNNILAIEYLKALIKLNSNIKPITFKRIGSNYKEDVPTKKIASATGIRNKILNQGIESIIKHVPSETYNHLINYINNYKNFNTLDNYAHIINYLLRINGKSRLKEIMDVERGLENRIIEKSTEFNDLNNLIESIVTKRYVRTRIQRIFIHLMIGLTKSTFKNLLPHHPAYIRVLGANTKGFALLNKINKASNIPVITKFSSYTKYKDPYLEEIISFDKKATDLFFLGLNTSKPFMDMDYYTSPYILKK